MDWISTRSVCYEIRSEHETFEYGWDETRDKKFDSFLKGEGILSLITHVGSTWPNVVHILTLHVHCALLVPHTIKTLVPVCVAVECVRHVPLGVHLSCTDPG